MRDEFKIALIQDSLKFALKSGQDIHEIPGEALHIKVLLSLSSSLHFSGVTVVPDDGEIGARLENGSWTGTVGTVQRNEADFSAAQVTLTSARMEAVDFSFPFLFHQLVFTVRSKHVPLQEGFSVFFLSPFSLQIWLATASAIVMVYLLFSVWTTVMTEVRGLSTGVGPALLVPVRILLKQDLDIRSWYATTGGALFSVPLIGYLFISTFYCGMLTSSTSLSRRKEEIQSWKDVERAVRTREYTAIALRGTATQTFIQTSTQGPLDTIRRTGAVYAKTRRDAMEDVLYARAIYVGPELKIKHAVEEHGIKTDIVHVCPEGLLLFMDGFAYNRNFPEKEYLDRGIIRLIETGMIEKWKSQQIFQFLLHSNKPSSSATNLIQMSDLGHLFLMWSVGIATATFLCLAEIIATKIIIIRHNIKNNPVMETSDIEAKAQNDPISNCENSKRKRHFSADITN